MAERLKPKNFALRERDSQSEQRIRFISPARGDSHIISELITTEQANITSLFGQDGWLLASSF